MNSACQNPHASSGCTDAVAALISSLRLERHPEGGWFRETYRSSGTIPASALPQRCDGARSFCTAIYYLLEQGDCSALHRIASDELWHFHSGDPLELHLFSPVNGYECITLGGDCTQGSVFQAVVPAGTWFGAEVAGEGSHALVSCTVSPGFDFADFEMGTRELMCEQFPSHRNVICRLTSCDNA